MKFHRVLGKVHLSILCILFVLTIELNRSIFDPFNKNYTSECKGAVHFGFGVFSSHQKQKVTSSHPF